MACHNFRLDSCTHCCASEEKPQLQEKYQALASKLFPVSRLLLTKIRQPVAKKGSVLSSAK